MTIKELKMPVLWSAPASYMAIPIELHFAHVKRKYSEIYYKNRESCLRNHGCVPKGEHTQLVTDSIAQAIGSVSRETIKKSYRKKLGNLSGFLEENPVT
jgi:hypothetical protein